MASVKKLFILVFCGLLASATLVFGQTAEQNAYSRFMKEGSALMRSGDYEGARESFERALEYNDTASGGHLSIGIAYFRLRDDKHAEWELNRALEINPKETMAYEILGELYYRKDDLETAASNWEKAVALNPSNAALRARLDRIRKENKAEQNFNRDMTGHFLAKYEGREKAETGRIVLRILEDAYREVGRELACWPDREIQVILYSGQQFKEVTNAPGWSGAIFDGKIRIPIGGIEKETPELRKLLYHEYTHAVVHSITRRCPTWLNEGLAQYFEGRQIDQRQREALRQIVLTGKLPSLKSLEGSFTGLGTSHAYNAYLFSLSAVRYMIASFGVYRVRGMLDELAKGADTGSALSRSIMMTYDEFERGWKQSLE